MEPKIKNVEGWWMPENELSVMKKLRSIREALNNPTFPIDDYQVELRQAALKHVHNFEAVIDVGAHIGIWSVAFSNFFKQVYAFEINLDVIPCLQQNLLDRKIANVQVFNCGLGEKEEQVSLIPTATKSMAVFVLPNTPGTVSVKPLDQFGLGKVSLIKLDVEGYESFVLRGGAKTITQWKPIIVLENQGLHQRYEAESPEVVLKELGMIELEKFRKDEIWGW